MVDILGNSVGDALFANFSAHTAPIPFGIGVEPSQFHS